MASAAAEEFFKLLTEDRHATYSYVSALAFISYDIILSFSRETKYIWGSKWSAVKALYFVVRYYAVINLIPIVAIWTRTSPGLIIESSRCKSYFYWTIIAGPSIFIVTLDGILMLRVWALYNRSKPLFVVLLILVLADFGAALFSVVEFARTLAENVVRAPDPWRGCSSTAPNTKTILLAYVPNFALSLLFLAMTLWKLFQNQKMFGDVSWTNLRDLKGMSPLLVAFVRDGSIFFALACLAGFLGLMATYVVHGVIASVFYPWTLVIYSFSGAHLVLGLRAAGKEDTDQTWDATMSAHHARGRVTRGMTFA
ncbi:hypothetical protein M413DRAFT_31898 [Hebeloma cylindrosporum]|uniref:DUF6533 domain-containing protein n=1 Tax=Hebeloma cylindrosporum TaxID=76867 RepID=A0A0C3BVQ1_HEBCY|nr:hypothetical protein M413DRAFT_31898 [Hebeloma cylindrosporum h7]